MAVRRSEMFKVLHTLKCLGILTSTWPPDPKSRKRVLILRELLWSIAVLNAIGTMIPMALNVFQRQNDVVNLMKTLSEFTALSDVFLNLILCRVGRTKLQNLIVNIEDFSRTASESENVVLGKYITRYMGFSLLSMSAYLSAAIVFSCGPLLMSTHLPADTWYPFSTQPLVVRVTLYVTQVAAILQTGFNLTVDFTVAMLFWYAAARLEMLKMDLENMRNESEINLGIKKHQEIIRFVEKTQDTVVYIISKTNITMGCAVIFGGIPLVYKQPATVMAQFFCMVIGGCQKLYITAWPADNLREMSENFGTAVFNAKWMRSAESSKNIYFLIQRSQKPLVIRMGSLLPILSLEYYSKFLKTICSYFMAMRAVLDG